MKIYLLIIVLAISQICAQHTFSIVAVDTISKEVGSAGATCLSINREGYEALIISRLHPGIGAIHTQSYWNSLNQEIASELMNSGMTSNEIIDYLANNDVDNNPSIRQYGIARMNSSGTPDAAGYTGENCLNEKKHKVGRHYSIQGNILLGEYIIDSMEARFLRAKGSLADRLMEAMKGALIAGADSRCLNEGISSRSSFLRVAKPSDSTSFYLDIHVPSTRIRLDPIDSLETLYKKWKNANLVVNEKGEHIRINYNPIEHSFLVKGLDEANNYSIQLFDLQGKNISRLIQISDELYKSELELQKGIYFIQINRSERLIFTSKIIVP